MKRARLFLRGLVLLLVLVGTSAAYLLNAPGSKQLTNGAWVRLFTVTTGTRHRITFPTRSWLHHYEKEFSRPIHKWHFTHMTSRPHGWTGAVSNVPSTVIWFQFDRSVSYEATLVTADGQRYQTKGANGPSTDGYAYAGMQFPIVSTEPTLKLDVLFEGEPFHFDVSNPAYSENGRL